MKGGIVVLRLTVIRLHTLHNKPGIYCGPLRDFIRSFGQSGDVSLTVSKDEDFNSWRTKLKYERPKADVFGLGKNSFVMAKK